MNLSGRQLESGKQCDLEQKREVWTVDIDVRSLTCSQKPWWQVNRPRVTQTERITSVDEIK